MSSEPCIAAYAPRVAESRTVRFEAPHTANSSPQPIVLPEQIEVPQADWEDEMPLEGESFEVAQASEELQELVELAVAREPQPPADEVLQSLIVSEPLPWAQQREEEEGPRVPAEPEPEVVEEIPEEEREYCMEGRKGWTVSWWLPSLVPHTLT